VPESPWAKGSSSTSLESATFTFGIRQLGISKVVADYFGQSVEVVEVVSILDGGGGEGRLPVLTRDCRLFAWCSSDECHILRCQP